MPLAEISLVVVGAQHATIGKLGQPGPNRMFEILVSHPGEPVDLRPEPANPADMNAIAIYSSRGIQIGYVAADRTGLSAFEDFEAEQQALDFVVGHADAALALDFLIAWPKLKRTAKLVLQRLDQLEGRRYDILRPAAAALDVNHPGAATLLHQRLVSSVIDRAASKYYPYAARDFQAAAGLADAIEGDASVPSHPTGKGSCAASTAARWLLESHRGEGLEPGGGSSRPRGFSGSGTMDRYLFYIPSRGIGKL